MPCVLVIQSIEYPAKNVDNLYDKSRKQNITRNRHIVKSNSKAVLFRGRQCIALEGDDEHLNESDQPVNHGKFLVALYIVAQHEDILHQHLHSLGLMYRNCKYIAPKFKTK